MTRSYARHHEEEAAIGMKYSRPLRIDGELPMIVALQHIERGPLALGRGARSTRSGCSESTVCKPTTPKWRATVERLKERFPGHAK